MEPDDLAAVLGRYRIPLNNEAEVQASIAEVLDREGVGFEREVVLGPGMRIDFMVGKLGVEVKAKGSASEIYRQCKRYCESGRVDSLLLVSNKPMGFPGSISGVPCGFFSLGRSWL